MPIHLRHGGDCDHRKAFRPRNHALNWTAFAERIRPKNELAELVSNRDIWVVRLVSCTFSRNPRESCVSCRLRVLITQCPGSGT